VRLSHPPPSDPSFAEEDAQSHSALDDATDTSVGEDVGAATASSSRPAAPTQRSGAAADDPDAYVMRMAKSKKRITMSLATAGEVVCSVCGERGHTAGFRGSVYVDCLTKPCYLCKEPGHTTATCPHRADPTHNVEQAAGSARRNLAASLVKRELAPTRCVRED